MRSNRFRGERVEATIGVVEGVLEILDQFGFCLRRIAPTLFAVFGRFLALESLKQANGALVTCFICSLKLWTPSNSPAGGTNQYLCSGMASVRLWRLPNSSFVPEGSQFWFQRILLFLESSQCAGSRYCIISDTYLEG